MEDKVGELGSWEFGSCAIKAKLGSSSQKSLRQSQDAVLPEGVPNWIWNPCWDLVGLGARRQKRKWVEVGRCDGTPL